MEAEEIRSSLTALSDQAGQLLSQLSFSSPSLQVARDIEILLDDIKTLATGASDCTAIRRLAVRWRELNNAWLTFRRVFSANYPSTAEGQARRTQLDAEYYEKFIRAISNMQQSITCALQDTRPTAD